MYDIFISHSSQDKATVVEPLVKSLEAKGLAVWYDKNNIYKGDRIKESILSGINESVIYLAVVSNNFFQSNWVSLELGVLQSTLPDNLLPLFCDKTQDIAAKTYPFLLDCNYIELSSNIESTADELYRITTQRKQDTGFWYISKTNIKHLIREIHSYNDFSLYQIAILLCTISKRLEANDRFVFNDITGMLHYILKDVAFRENIFVSAQASLISLFLDIDFLSHNLKEHIRFLQTIQATATSCCGNWTLSQENRYLVQLSIFSIVEWYILSYYKKPSFSSKKLVPIQPEELTYDDIVETNQIEKLVLPPDLIASAETTFEWFQHNPLTMIGARDVETGKLVGFFNTLPITDDLFEKIKSGDFDDTKLSLEQILQYDIPGFYKLYLCSFCIHPAYNTTTAFKVIYSSFVDFLLNLATEHEIFISDIIADGVTLKGSRLCESIGMNKIKSTTHKSNLYHAALIPPELSTLKLNNLIGKRLISYYTKIYSEYKEMF